MAALSTTCLAGGLSCGAWDFESGTAEGWTLDIGVPGEPRATLSEPTSSTVFHSSGARSLAGHFDGTGATVQSPAVLRLTVPLCSGAQTVSLDSKSFAMDIAFQINANLIDMNLETGTISWGGTSSATPAGTNSFDFRPSFAGQHVVFVFPTGATSSYISIAVPLLPALVLPDMVTSSPWIGTVFLDNITIQ